MAFMTKDKGLAIMLSSVIGGGLLVGAFVGILNRLFRLPFLISAMMANGVFYGLASYLLQGGFIHFEVSLPVEEMYFLLAVGILLALTVLFLLRSQLGYSFAIYGNNPFFFERHGLNGSYVLLFGLLLGHSLAAVSGFLFAQSNGFVDLTMQTGIVLTCITAVILGKLVTRSFRPNILVPLLGVVFYLSLQQLLLKLGLNLRYFNAFQALLILATLLIGQKRYQRNPLHLGV